VLEGREIGGEEEAESHKIPNSVFPHVRNAYYFKSGGTAVQDALSMSVLFGQRAGKIVTDGQTDARNYVNFHY
jgi:hypothetical protein